MQEHPAHYLDLRDGGFLAGNRAFVLDAEVAAFAQPGQRAAFALGLFAAYERAQLHEPLIEVPGLAFRDEGLRQFADAALGGFFLYRRVDVEHAGQDALHIAVHAGDFLVVGCAGDGPGGVRAHAGQGEDVGVAGGEVPAVAFHDHPGGGLDVARAAVVAEPFPCLEQVFLGRGGDGGHVGETLHPTQEVLDAPVHLRLLHHDFGDPRPVRRVVGPPRQRAAVLGEPAEQVFSEKRKALCIVHGKEGCMLEPGELL